MKHRLFFLFTLGTQCLGMFSLGWLTYERHVCRPFLAQQLQQERLLRPRLFPPFSPPLWTFIDIQPQPFQAHILIESCDRMSTYTARVSLPVWFLERFDGPRDNAIVAGGLLASSWGEPTPDPQIRFRTMSKTNREVFLQETVVEVTQIKTAAVMVGVDIPIDIFVSSCENTGKDHV